MEIKEQNTDTSSQSFDWDIEKFENLLKYSNDTKFVNSSSNETALEESEESQTIETDETDANYQFDSNDDPHNGKTKPTLAGNPFAKFGIVGTGFGAIFLIAALILNAITNPPQTTEIPQETPTVDNGNQKEAEKVANLEKTNARLKALIALGNQAQKIQDTQKELEKPQPKKLEREKATKKPEIQQKANNSVAKLPNLSSNSSNNRRARQSTPKNSLPRNRVANNPSTNSRTRNTNKLPTQPIVSTPTPVKRNPIALKSPKPQLPAPEPNIEKVNPTEQWMAMNRLGSYGSIEQETISSKYCCY